ncbi:MAG: ABC transporter substrate-binding protein [Moraxellaceae bacterium]|nr:ABC transporter substrate-binding protein [Moraxellaceae bacterium]
MSLPGGRYLFRSLALLLPALLLAGCPTDVDDPVTPPLPANAIVIGMIQPQASGPSLEKELAARLAIQEINAAGGVNGRPLALQIAYDGNNNAVLGVQAAQQLVDSGVVAIIGANASRVTLPVAEQVTIPAGVALISPGSTSPLVSQLVDNDTVWRIPPSDALQGRLLAEKVWDEGHNTVAVFSLDEPYGQGLAGAFRDRFLALGGSIHAEAVAPSSRESGFSTEIDALYAGGTPSVLMLFTFAVPTVNLLREIVTAKGSLPMLYGVDGNMTTDTLNNAPSQAAGMRGSTPAAASNSPEFQRFLDAYVGATGFVPGSNTENAYDAVYLVALALAAAGSNERADVVAQLRSVSGPDGAAAVKVGPGDFAAALAAIAAGDDIDYEGASGPVDFDAQGDPSAATYLYQEIRLVAGVLQLVTLETIPYP